MKGLKLWLQRFRAQKKIEQTRAYATKRKALDLRVKAVVERFKISAQPTDIDYELLAKDLALLEDETAKLRKWRVRIGVTLLMEQHGEDLVWEAERVKSDQITNMISAAKAKDRELLRAVIKDANNKLIALKAEREKRKAIRDEWRQLES